jgi:hypothetical protein
LGTGISQPVVPSPGSRRAQSIRPPGPAARPTARVNRHGVPPRNKPENTIAPLSMTAYHGFMTTWQTLKRAGYMHPDSSLEAALFSNRRGVVAV